MPKQPKRKYGHWCWSGKIHVVFYRNAYFPLNHFFHCFQPIANTLYSQMVRANTSDYHYYFIPSKCLCAQFSFIPLLDRWNVSKRSRYLPKYIYIRCYIWEKKLVAKNPSGHGFINAKLSDENIFEQFEHRTHGWKYTTNSFFRVFHNFFESEATLYFFLFHGISFIWLSAYTQTKHMRLVSCYLCQPEKKQ